ncbi:MAG TPA: radical SAM protein [Candidatus Limnocylindrales bacterium]
MLTRPYRPLRMVLTVCGRCFEEDPDRTVDYERDILQGSLVAQDGAVYLRRHCQRGHGEVVSLYEEDAERWAYLQQWRVPTREVVPDAPTARPIPMGYLDGLGPLQDQHTCVLLLDLTEDCNLACPTCFMGGRPGRDRYARVADVLRTVDGAIEREGGALDLLMLSGGEPTLHPGLDALLAELIARPVTRVVVNTNGLRLARDDRLLAVLADRRGRVEVYLQFDGLSEAAQRHHRDRDLRATKQAALARLTAARVFTTLAATVEAGINDGEVGAIVDLALGTDYVGGVALQPLFGRAVRDPLLRLTTTGTLRRLREQTGGRVGPDDFIGLPCSHPDCSAIGYFVRTDEGRWRSLVGLVGVDRLRTHLGLVGNRIVPDDELWRALTALLSETMLVSRPELVEHLATLSDVCALGLSGFVRTLGRFVLGPERVAEAAALRVKRLSVKSFMDPWTMNVERLKQCCIHVGSVEAAAPPVRIPFCARQTFAPLRARTSTGLVARAELAPGGRVAPTAAR